MSRDLSLALRLYTDTARYVSGLTQAESRTRRFANNVKAELSSLRNSVSGLSGKLAGLGISFGIIATLAQSARMDKSLTQIGQTAGASADEVAKLREELFAMARTTGQDVDDLQGGFNNAVQAGLTFKEALPVLDATNKAMAVTGANADRLTSGLTVAASAFQFDLSQPGLALSLLDEMVVAGRLGNAELENLSDIFARVGVNASSARMSFDKTLAFIETLSLVEKQPQRLATLADSTLRLFTNLNYMKHASKATGVKFYADGKRRDPIDVLKDFQDKFKKLKSETARDIFIFKAFGKTDLDTMKGLRTLLAGDNLDKIEEMARQIKDAGGSIKRDLPAAINNSIDQTGRLKAELRKAANEFSEPINDTY